MSVLSPMILMALLLAPTVPSAPEAPEFTLDCAFGGGVDGLSDRQGSVGDIIGDPHGKMVFGFGRLHVVQDGHDHGRGKFLGAETIPAANDGGLFAGFHEGGNGIEIERIAKAPGSLVRSSTVILWPKHGMA